MGIDRALVVYGNNMLLVSCGVFQFFPFLAFFAGRCKLVCWKEGERDTINRKNGSPVMDTVGV